MPVSNYTRNNFKRCGRCKVLKQITDFGLVRGKPRSTCKVCKRAEYHKLEKRTEKKCSRCKVTKPIEDFATSGQQKRHYCNECQPIINCSARNRRRMSGEDQAYWRKYYDERRRWNRLNQKYGITEEDYQFIMSDQNGVCAICEKPETEVYKGKTLELSVDHDHKTGRVRGLLCRQCNIGIGKLGESADTLRRAAEYVERYTE